MWASKTLTKIKENRSFHKNVDYTLQITCQRAITTHFNGNLRATELSITQLFTFGSESDIPYSQI